MKKATRILFSLIAVVVAQFNAHATAVSISGTFNYGYGLGAASSYMIQFNYDPAYPLTYVPAGTIEAGYPLVDDFYVVPGAGISDLYMQIGNAGWLTGTTTGFWIDGDIGVAGTPVHYLMGGFSSAAGDIAFGNLAHGYVWDDVFISGGGFSPGVYTVKVAASIPENDSTASLAAMACIMLGLVEIRRRKIPRPAGD